MYIFLLLFQRIPNQHQIRHFLIPILEIFGKNIFWVILHFLQTFKPNAHETVQKNEKCILQMCLRINFFIHLSVRTFNFLKKSLNCCSLLPMLHEMSIQIHNVSTHPFPPPSLYLCLHKKTVFEISRQFQMCSTNRRDLTHSLCSGDG